MLNYTSTSTTADIVATVSGSGATTPGPQPPGGLGEGNHGKEEFLQKSLPSTTSGTLATYSGSGASPPGPQPSAPVGWGGGSD